MTVHSSCLSNRDPAKCRDSSLPSGAAPGRRELFPGWGRRLETSRRWTRARADRRPRLGPAHLPGRRRGARAPSRGTWRGPYHHVAVMPVGWKQSEKRWQDVAPCRLDVSHGRHHPPDGGVVTQARFLHRANEAVDCSPTVAPLLLLPLTHADQGTHGDKISWFGARKRLGWAKYG